MVWMSVPYGAMHVKVVVPRVALFGGGMQGEVLKSLGTCSRCCGPLAHPLSCFLAQEVSSLLCFILPP